MVQWIASRWVLKVHYRPIWMLKWLNQPGGGKVACEPVNLCGVPICVYMYMLCIYIYFLMLHLVEFHGCQKVETNLFDASVMICCNRALDSQKMATQT